MIHQAIAEGLSEELQKSLGSDYQIESHSNNIGERWGVKALYKRFLGWPQVDITLDKTLVQWHGYYCTCQWKQPEGADYAYLVKQGLSSHSEYAYADPRLVDSLLLATARWMVEHRYCADLPVPQGLRKATFEEFKPHWLEGSASAFFDSIEDIPPMLLKRDSMAGHY